jgi:5-methylcytosine-specific restriction endonuclease McrA
MLGMTTKLCRRCGISKPRIAFYPIDLNKPARGRCRRCVIQLATISNSVSPNREANLRRYNNSPKGEATQRRFDEAHPGKRKHYIAKHYQIYPERLLIKRDRDRETQAARYQADPETAKALAAASIRRHPETKRAIDHRRRAHLWRAIGFHTSLELKAIWEQQSGCCAICKAQCWRTVSPDGTRKREWTIDHIHPISDNGTEWAWNLRGLCRSCNAAKKDRVE